MNIGILYLCTGNYKMFWEKFYESSEKNFLTQHTKHYFVFTDTEKIKYGNLERVNIEKTEVNGWPLGTLLRFHMFKSIESELEKMDYIFFFNANIEIVKEICDSEVMPDPILNDGLMCLQHPYFVNKKSITFPYERRKRSKAYIPYRDGKVYYQGFLNGGITENYIKLINECMKNIDKDLEKNIFAKWLDESHLNKYLVNKNPLTLSPSYGYPENSNLPYDIKILSLDKIKNGGEYFRNIKKVGIYIRVKRRIETKINAFINRKM